MFPRDSAKVDLIKFVLDARKRMRCPDESIGPNAVELTSDDLRDIESAIQRFMVQGARHPEKLKQMTNWVIYRW